MNRSFVIADVGVDPPIGVAVGRYERFVGRAELGSSPGSRGLNGRMCTRTAYQQHTVCNTCPHTSWPLCCATPHYRASCKWRTCAAIYMVSLHRNDGVRACNEPRAIHWCPTRTEAMPFGPVGGIYNGSQ